MSRQPPVTVSLAILRAAALAAPTGLLAVPDTAGQRAGQVDRLIPAVGITRGSQRIKASSKTYCQLAGPDEHRSQRPGTHRPR